MASIAASMRRLTLSTLLQTPCRTAGKIGAPRSFSVLRSLQAELSVGGQGQAEQVRVLEKRGTPEGHPDQLIEKDWEFDDISSMAHAELERHREARQYARITAYEMPLLSELVKPFEPPTTKQVLRFRYTTYMGEKHPAESKVVCEFSPLDLGLNPVEERKLVKLVGVRYNPDNRIVRMSCEMFEHQAQNMRYLSDLVDKLVVEAKDLTDDFEDVPLDFRHHEAKKGPRKPKFPKKWLMTPERREKLQAERAELEAAFL